MKDRQGKRIIGKTVKIFIIFLMAAAVILPQTIMCGHADEDNNELTVQMGTSADNMITLNAGGGQTYSAPLNKSRFDINISGEYPSNATSKQLDITLAYGLTWWVSKNSSGYARASYDVIDQAQPWYKAISAITGADKPFTGGADGQNFHSESTEKYNNKVYDGTVTFQFKDELTEFKTTDLAFGTLGYFGLNSRTGEDYLSSINNPVEVTLSYVQDGVLHKTVRNLSKMNFENLPEKAVTGVSPDSKYQDSNGHLIAPRGGTTQFSATSWWAYITPSQTGGDADYYKYLFSDWYMLYKVPAALKYSAASHNRGILSENDISYNDWIDNYRSTAPDGKHIDLNNDEKLVMVHLNPGPGQIALNVYKYYPFQINWEFPSDSFENGQLVDVELADANFKYESASSYLAPPDDSPKITYIVTDPEPDVFGGDLYSKNYNNNELSFSANMSASPEINYAQEEEGGSAFAIGNRGSGASNPKTIHIDFDEKNHGGYGVTYVVLPHTTNDAGHDLTIRYHTWNGEDASTISSEKSKVVHIDSNGNGNTFSASQTDGYRAGVFLKDIEYDIGRIPALWDPGNFGAYGCWGGRNTYGVTLTDQKITSDADNGIIMRMTAYDTGGDPSDAVTDTRYVNLSGKYYEEPLSAIANDSTIVAGETKRIEYRLYSGIGIVDKIYVISPYGDEFTNWNVRSSYDDLTDEVIIKEIDTSHLKLPEKYKNAKVYAVDFTEITDDDQKTFLKKRMNGSLRSSQSYYIPEEKDIINNQIYLSFNWNSSYSDPIGTTASDLIWSKQWYPTTKDGSPDEEAMVRRYANDNNIWRKNETIGFPEREDTWFTVRGSINIVGAQSLGVTVNSSSKYSNDLHTWENNDTYTEMANDGMKYQLVVGNGTNTDINHAELYIPVPKKKEQWGQKYQNNNFNYDMKLSGMPSFTKGANSEGQCTWYYTTSTSGTPEDASFTDWHELKNDTYLSGVTMLKAALTDIKKQSVQTIDVPLETTMTDLSGEPVNQWKTVYVSHMTTATTAPSSVPVTAQIKNIQLKGYVWMDANHDGKKDSDESFMKDVHLTLHNGTVSSESVTDANGGYTFNTYSTNPGQYIEITLPDGTFITQKQNDSVFDPGTHQYTFENGLNKTSYDGLNCGLINVPVVTIKKADSKSKKDIGEVGFELKKDENAVNVNGRADGSFLIHDTDKNTGFTIRDLADGTYTLTETKTPFGYNALSGDVTFTVKNGVVSAGHDERISLSDDYKVLTVYNDPGIRLPDTGGKGTLIFRITGVGLIIAAVLLILEKRNGRR